MNLSKFGVTLLATTVLVGSTNACAATIQGKAVAQDHDNFSDWVANRNEPDVLNGWKLGVQLLYEVKPSLHKQFLGIGMLGDRCLVSFTQPDEQMKMEIKLFGRWNKRDSDIASSPEHPLSINGGGDPEEAAWYWVSLHYVSCVTQSV